MAFSFNPALPADLDWIRVTLGDVTEETALLADETITAVRAGAASRDAATLTLAEMCIAIIALQPIKTTLAGMSVDYTGRLDGLKRVVASLTTSLGQTERSEEIPTTRAVSTSIKNKATW